ncbi:MAG: DNA cytosine methyltransferase [Candidatus Marinimicrobia bacterium]|nr:DNA cytosine methyltransferase [Candidatus Neomarinimicrobiota bacterium]MCF7827788.1 DNA cytosine methyltransferase [Candidatus Neomarinimicrobiota bacterium]MCF7879457.1 DNA cytosine methyltransferase [Candidatus Neomarinimicrobiota bacterium]
MKYIDLFAGAGGLSEGFYREGFEAVAHIEKDHHACQTIKTRTAFHYLKQENHISEYIRYLNQEITREEFYDLIPDEILDTVIDAEISEETLEDLFNLIDQKLEDEELDLIIGGPPCQAYSSASAYIEEKNEKLIYLYELYGEFLDHFTPKMFIFENVPGIYTADEGKYYEGLKECFKNAGYEFEDKKLDASEFNVPQKRERVIIIGWRENLDLSYPEFEKKIPDTKIDELFNDLPDLEPGKSYDPGNHYTQGGSEYVNTYIRNGIDVLTHHIARPHNERDLNIYRMAIERWEGGARLKNSDIPEEMRTQKNISSFLDRFKVVDGEGFSHTMIAHIAKDGHYYIHPDQKQLRSISVREAARIQSFPDDYFFEGPRTSVFTQIGNAVPPILAQEIARKIKRVL